MSAYCPECGCGVGTPAHSCARGNECSTCPPNVERRAVVRWRYDDGGREAAGFAIKHDAGDCVARALAIAAELPYRVAYEALADESWRRGGKRSARNGVARDVERAVFLRHGFTWTPTMRIGSGCTVHLRADELPPGRIVCAVSKHLVAVVDGVAHDTSDPTRGGTRCVYGYYARPNVSPVG